ncbi:cAMP-dependent protein kinase regulatory subunit [Monosporozyma servazzii]
MIFPKYQKPTFTTAKSCDSIIMSLSNEQKSELDQFRREIELKKPSDFLQFGANYFNQKLEIQRNFIKKQEALALSKGIALFPPISQHNSILLPDEASYQGSHSSLSVQNQKFRSNSRNAVGDFSTIASPKNKNNATQGTPNFFKSSFGDGESSGRKSAKPMVETEDPKTSSSNATNPLTTIKAPIPSLSNSPDNIFKGGFDVGKESSKKRTNSPLDPSDTTNRKATPTSASLSSFAQPQSQNKQEKDSLLHQIPARFNAERRTSVSAETIQPDHFDDWVPEHYKEKTEDQLHRLEKAIGKNFLFNKLDSDSKRLVINCLEEKHIPANTDIIKQGDEGDYFYIVEEGSVEFYVNDIRVNTSGPGSSFGELALMYNNPRAATVVATSNCILWALDRMTFRKILLGSSFKKRVLYEDLLRSVPVLEKLTTYERSKLADSLDTQYYEPGEVIIREGDVGENFYLIEYGDVQVIKEGKHVLATLGKGDYFGELALINDIPRQATIKTTKKTKVATLGKSGFQRLLGPVVDVLKLKAPILKSKN